MAAIQVLSQETIDKIAAGEVIERPASVVKELVENSIDARATAITVEIKDGGTSLIRITDNGCGIAGKEVALAFLRHSTSKISTASDLATVSTLGFRGEALSSISAVAQVELLTKTRDSFMGVRYVIEGGREKTLEEAGTPDGTTFLVRNLFYNTPARKKFLKTNTTEGNYVQDLLERLALSHPEISFKFIHNNQMKFHTSGNNNLKDIIYQLYGREIAANLIPIDFHSEQVSLTGFIGKPLVSRGNRQYENYFVNGRYVRSNIVSKAIEQGYKGYMMQHKYPFTVLHVHFYGEELDVNVHPTKMELRFSNSEQVYQLFYHVITEALQRKELIPEVSITQNKERQSRQKQQERMPESFERRRIERMEQERRRDEALVQKNIAKNLSEETKKGRSLIPSRESSDTGKLLESLEKVTQKLEAEKAEKEEKKTQIEPAKINVSQKEISPMAADKPDVVPEQVEEEKRDRTDVLKETFAYHAEVKQVKSSEKENTQSAPAPSLTQLNLFEEQVIERRIKDEVVIIGQVFDTYWIMQFEDKMYLADQHAAHEKVLYERMMRQLRRKEHTSQLISPPLVVTLSGKESQLLEEHKEEFETLGFAIEAFGGKEYAISAIPANVFNLQAKELFLEMLDELTEETGRTKPEMMLEKIASMSCKAAIKGNQKISRAEAEALLKELMTLDNPYNCPHGRPVLISMSKYELEKKFKRIV